MDIRDPVHGPIYLSDVETSVVESPYFQRLRSIKQLGFSDLTWPGATHSRFLHSLGAMHVAGLAFDAVFRQAPWLPPLERQRFRQILRLAALCHDLGHPPLSHTSEVLLPLLRDLPLPGVRLSAADLDRQASHEHFTLKFLLDSQLTNLLHHTGRPLGIAPHHVAALLSESVEVDDAVFRCDGRQLQHILASLVSSELDVDRMDYLLRDSYFTGVSYGRFDLDWLVNHLTHFEAEDGHLHLALQERAIFTFDDFMLSRHHMFLMVYFHKKSVCYDHMLRRFYAQFPQACQASADPEAYLALDDHVVWRALRDHVGQSNWAAGIVHMNPLKMLAESTPLGTQEPMAELAQTLTSQEIPHLHVTSTGALSKYHSNDHARSIFVRRQPPVGRAWFQPLAQATQLFKRYAETTVLERVYVPAEHLAHAADLLLQLRGQSTPPEAH